MERSSAGPVRDPTVAVASDRTATAVEPAFAAALSDLPASHSGMAG